ncbi:MAG: DUF4190 domain-containing protein [Coriobacteriia bacterium]|nr:DUF4190 domain-containing protein [Coriobacteriia bacterium]
MPAGDHFGTPQNFPEGMPNNQYQSYNRGPQKQGVSGYAITSLVLGIIGLLGSIIPILNNVTFVLAGFAVIFAIIALVLIKKSGKSGKGLAISGLVLGVLGIILTLVVQAFFVAAIDQILEESATETNNLEESALVANGENSDASADAQGSEEGEPIGVTLVDDELMTFTVNKKTKDLFGAGYEVSIQNKSDKDLLIGLNNVSVNGTMQDVLFGTTVTAGKNANETITIMGIKDMNELVNTEATISVSDENTFERLAEYPFNVD